MSVKVWLLWDSMVEVCYSWLFRWTWTWQHVSLLYCLLWNWKTLFHFIVFGVNFPISIQSIHMQSLSCNLIVFSNLKERVPFGFRLFIQRVVNWFHTHKMLKALQALAFSGLQIHQIRLWLASLHFYLAWVINVLYMELSFSWTCVALLNKFKTFKPNNNLFEVALLLLWIALVSVCAQLATFDCYWMQESLSVTISSIWLNVRKLAKKACTLFNYLDFWMMQRY